MLYEKYYKIKLEALPNIFLKLQELIVFGFTRSLLGENVEKY
jgi:hypothetical protein